MFDSGFNVIYANSGMNHRHEWIESCIMNGTARDKCPL